MLLDEPTAGLDPGAREEMLQLIRRTGRDFGISIVLSSHIMGDVESTCDRVIVLDEGRVAQEGEVAELTRETATIFIEVDRNRDELVSALEKRDIHTDIDGLSVVVNLETEEQYDAIRDAIVEAKAPLRRLAPRRGHLTDIFRSVPE